ncbi:MAG: toast rack family protein [Anaerolineae bacterium]
MRKIIITLVALFVLGSTLACNVIPQIPDIQLPDIDIQVPTIEVGEMQDEQQAIPLSGAKAAAVEIIFGAGELEIEAGTSADLFSGHFRYNVERWEPEVTYEGDVLTVKQGGTEEDWGIPTGSTHNEWKLEFSPEIPLKMNLQVGAGVGEFDFTGLQLSALDMKLGAGDFEVRFYEPNEAEMSHLTLDAGASKLEVIGIGHAGPERMKVQGGVGDITLDFTGDWPNSADVQVTAGIGAITLRLPDDVGVRVETEGGLTSVDVTGLQRKGDAYVNDAFGEAEKELHIQVTTGIGNLRLIEVSN